MFYHDRDLRPTSDLCIRCGLCCVALRAQCTPEEAEAACPSNPERFAEPDDDIKEGNLLIRFPCMYLKGRLLGAVFCAIYDKERPKVCTSYLCRVAMLYAQGQVELKSALQLLKIAFWSSDVSVFNWAGFEGETNILRKQAVWQLAQKLREGGTNEQGLDLWAAQHCTPNYWPSTPLEHSLFSMHFMSFDHRESLEDEARREAERKALGLYYEPEETEQFSSRDIEVARMTVRHVLAQLRLYITDGTEVDYAQDTVEASSSAEADQEQGEPRVSPSDVDDGCSGGESEEARLCLAAGDQDSCGADG
jgi:Fe-S-cluster containining protein